MFGVAAGLIRVGKREVGIHLYTKLFDITWTGASTTDEKKNVVDNFLTSLSAGHKGNPYIDGEIDSVLEQQITKYADVNWTTKIKTTLGRFSF